MNIVFLIGNGFDLKLGLKTRYTDMYDSYIVSPSKSEQIDLFKKQLQMDEENKYENWSDFEIAMGKYANSFESEDAFIECIRDFKLHLRKHIENENQKFSGMIDIESNETCEAMRKFLRNFYAGQTPNVKNEMDQMMKDGCYYDFINFNYTDTLEQLLNQYEQKYIRHRYTDLVHIHGTLEEGIVLGVDNDTQIVNSQFSISRKLDRAFIKTKFNHMFDKTRFHTAEFLIERSDIICIYGMSLGDSDKTWVDKIREWLLQNPSHHLFYHYHSNESYSDADWDERMDEEDRRKDILLMKLFDDVNDREQVFDQIHIPVGYNMLDFKV